MKPITKRPVLLVLLSFLPVFISGSYLGVWLKVKNLAFYSTDLAQVLPEGQWVQAALNGALPVSLLFLLEVIAFMWILGLESKRKILYGNAASYLCFFLLAFSIPVKIVFLLFLVSKLVLLFQFKPVLVEWLDRNKPHLTALLLITLAQVSFNDFVSVRAWYNPIAGLNQFESLYIGPASSSILYDYKNAKRFDFSSFDHSFWGGMPHAPVSGNSSIIPLLVNIFDLPIIDYTAQARLLLLLFFVVCTVGSFSFYCFLHFGLELSRFVSILGGFCYVVSNAFLADQFTSHFPLFISPFLLLPIALLLSKMAFKKVSPSLGFLGGLLFSFHFYILFSHPDPIIHATFFWVLFLLFQLCTHKKTALPLRAKIFSLSLIGYGIGAFYKSAPIFQFLFFKEGQIFGHTDLNYLFYGWEEGHKFLLLPLLWLVLFFPVFLIPGCWKNFREKKSSDVGFFLFCFVALLFMFFPGHDGLFIKMLEYFKITTLNFNQTARVLMYFGLSALILLLYGVNWFIHSKETQKNNFAKALNIFWILLLLVYITRKFTVFAGFLPGAILLILLLIWDRKKHAHNSPSYLFFYGILSATILLLLQYGSLQWKSPRLFENSHNCSRYISLQALLTSMEFHPEDATKSTELIKRRIIQYETDLSRYLGKGADRTIRKAHYPLSANNLALDKISSSSAEYILQLAEKLYPEIDSFYLKDAECIYQKDLNVNYDNFIQSALYYNFSGIFKSFEHRFDRILSASINNCEMGLNPGALLQDANQSTDVRVMKVYPPLNALYMLPGENYKEVGSYGLIKRWQQQGTEVFTNPTVRKHYNVSGQQVFVVKNEQFEKIKDKSDLTVLPDPTPESLRSSLLLVKDKRAYDTVFLASSVRYIPTKINDLQRFRFPLSGDAYTEYKKNVDTLTEKIKSLEQKHAVLIEDDSKPENFFEAISTENQLQIKNIFGNKAVFNVQCTKSPCIVTFNTAALRGWRAFSDGNKLPIRRANFAFLSAEVPEGNHLVWFEYAPCLVTLGWYLTLCGAITGLFLLLFFNFLLPKESRNINGFIK